MKRSQLTADPERTRDWQMRSRKRLATRSQIQCRHPMKKNSRIRQLGKKGLAWNYARQWLKIQFARVGIITCQLKFPGCWFDNALSFCHPAKRRKLTPRELYVVCLGCTPCHEQLEVMPAADMRRIVEGLFAATGIRIPKERVIETVDGKEVK